MRWFGVGILPLVDHVFVGEKPSFVDHGFAVWKNSRSLTMGSGVRKSGFGFIHEGGVWKKKSWVFMGKGCEKRPLSMMMGLWWEKRAVTNNGSGVREEHATSNDESGGQKPSFFLYGPLEFGNPTKNILMRVACEKRQLGVLWKGVARKSHYQR